MRKNSAPWQCARTHTYTHKIRYTVVKRKVGMEITTALTTHLNRVRWPVSNCTFGKNDGHFTAFHWKTCAQPVSRRFSNPHEYDRRLHTKPQRGLITRRINDINVDTSHATNGFQTRDCNVWSLAQITVYFTRTSYSAQTSAFRLWAYQSGFHFHMPRTSGLKQTST